MFPVESRFGAEVTRRNTLDLDVGGSSVFITVHHSYSTYLGFRPSLRDALWWLIRVSACGATLSPASLCWRSRWQHMGACCSGRQTGSVCLKALIARGPPTTHFSSESAAALGLPIANQ